MENFIFCAVSVNVKLSDSQLVKLKSATINETGVTQRLSPNMIGTCNDETASFFTWIITNW